MNCKQYWQKTLGESSIHGFPYLVRQELHWLEKIFWAFVIIFAAYFSIDTCRNQWKRFRDNPIVYAVELAWGISDFPFVGITLCSTSFSQQEMDRIIEYNWHVTATKNDTRYNYFMNFLNVLNSLNFMNLDNLRPYENDSNFNNLTIVDTLVHLRNIEYEDTNNIAETDDGTTFDNEKNKQIYATAMTEMGICRTTSQLSRYTNPFGDLKALKASDVRYCDVMNECNSKIFPTADDAAGLSIFFHNVEDIVAPYGKGTTLRQTTIDGSLTVEMLLGLTTAEAEVRNLPIAFRKCRYKDENNLKYFETYRPGLCRIECRINVALKKCGCKPFFYVMAPHLPACNVKGMVCLAKVHWPKVAECNCPDLCEEETYVSTQTTMQKSDSAKFESTVIVKLFLPRTAVKRRVVFSTDQLIMSFGGAIGLFLGASFISLYGLLYTLSEYICGNLWSCLKHGRQAKQQNLKAEHRIIFVKEVY